jgi:hypothetical protein
VKAPNPYERDALDELRSSLEGWALGDAIKAASAGAKVGAFLLAAHLIDTLAGFYSSRGDGKARWDEFTKALMPRYRSRGELLYRGYRGPLSHHYSLNGVRLVDARPDRHLRVEAGELVLNLEDLVDDLGAALNAFFEEAERDEVLLRRVLERTGQRPTLAILEGVEPAESASVAHTRSTATHFGSSFTLEFPYWQQRGRSEPSE